MKQKNLPFPRNLTLKTLGELLKVFSAKVPTPFIDLEVLSFASYKAKLFVKNVSNNSNLDDSGIFLPVFPSRTNLRLHNVSVTLKMVKKVITNLDLLKVSVLQLDSNTQPLSS